MAGALPSRDSQVALWRLCDGAHKKIRVSRARKSGYSALPAAGCQRELWAMPYLLSWYLHRQLGNLPAGPARQRQLREMLRSATGTHLEPTTYERQLLSQFERGQLTLEQVLQRLAT